MLGVTATYLDRIGGLIRDARKHRGLTQTQLADVLGTSQSAVHRIEAGNQNLSLEMVNRIAAALDSTLISVGGTGPQHLRVEGGTKLTGSIDVRSSKNAAVGLLCASLLNHGRTVFRGIAKIEEVNRILEVLTSIGVQARWLDTQRPRARPTGQARPGRDGHRGGPADPLGDHVPRPAAALLHQVRAAVRRRLRPRRADDPAAPAGAAPLRPGRDPDRRLLPLHGRRVGRAADARSP